MKGKEAKAIYQEKSWLKFYPEGCPAEVEIPQKSVPQVFDEAVERWGRGRTAIIFYGRKISYGELKDQIDKFATALWDLGVRKGDRVALYMVNCPQFIIAYFGILRTGATVTPISPVYVSLEVKHQIEDSGAETLICLDLLYDSVEKAEVKLKNIILTNIAEYLPTTMKLLGKGVLRSVYHKMSAPSPAMFKKEGIHRFQDLINKSPANPPKIESNPEEDIASLPYTGGTTGVPKGVMITHYNLVAAQRQMRAFETYMEEGKETILGYMPFYHIGGQVSFMMHAMTQCFTLIVFSTPDLDAILSAVERYQASTFGATPGMLQTLRDHDKTGRVRWKRLKSIDTGADILLEDIAIGWEKRTGTKVYDHWGLTETTSAAAASPIGRPKLGSVGIPLPNVMMGIVDPDGTEFLPLGETGEIVVTAPTVMKGYWNKPEETAEAFMEMDGEKWFRTGDLGKMDEEGYFYVYDRKKDLIKYKGLSVFAREVEEVLMAHPAIKYAGVIGVPNPNVGQDIKAAVVLESEARGKISEEEITKYCEERLAHYKVPRIIEFRGEVPKTDVGKVSRRELREEAQEEL